MAWNHCPRSLEYAIAFSETGHSVGGAGSIELHGQFQPYIGNFFKDRGAGRRSMRGDLPCLPGGSERGCDNRALPRGLLTPRGPSIRFRETPIQQCGILFVSDGCINYGVVNFEGPEYERMATSPDYLRLATSSTRALADTVFDSLRDAVVVVDARHKHLPVVLANAAARRCLSPATYAFGLIESSLQRWLGGASPPPIETPLPQLPHTGSPPPPTL